MKTLAYRILNVFTVSGDRLSGNPLCVFEDGSALSDAEMQALARQFNLSETTFLLRPTKAQATARVRIFTPTFEMPFAGHPTLGTAHVVRSLASGDRDRNRDRVVLEMKAGEVDVTARGDRWKLRTARSPESRVPSASRGEIAAMIGLPASAIAADPMWLDTGAEQLVIPLASADDVRRAKPSASLLGQHGFSPKRNASMAYVWAPLDSAETSGSAKTVGDEEQILARFFFNAHDSVVEDPATGSACANLGGYLLMTSKMSGNWRIHQGEAIGRPSHLHLQIDAAGQIFVAGEVIELGKGTLSI